MQCFNSTLVQLKAFLIKTKLFFCNSFNSTLVQLKGGFRLYFIFYKNCFNSTLVQLKVGYFYDFDIVGEVSILP